LLVFVQQKRREEKRKENKDEAAVLPCTAALRWEEIMYLALGLL